MIKPDFDVQRAWYYLRNLVGDKSRSFGLVAAVIAGAYILLYLVATRFGWVANLPDVFFLLTVTFVGLGISAIAFSAIHRDGEGVVWFMLPASRLEKFVVTSLVNTVGVLLGLALTLFAADLVSRGLVLILGMNIGAQILNPFWGNNLQDLVAAFCFQTMFLFASVRFAKHPALKIFLWSLLVLVIMGGLNALVWWLLFNDYQPGRTINFTIRMDQTGWSTDSGPLPGLLGLVFSAFFLFATWLRLGESEVKDGIR